MNESDVRSIHRNLKYTIMFISESFITDARSCQVLESSEDWMKDNDEFILPLPLSSGLLFNCLSCNITAKISFSFVLSTAVHLEELFHIFIIAISSLDGYK